MEQELPWKILCRKLRQSIISRFREKNLPNEASRIRIFRGRVFLVIKSGEIFKITMFSNETSIKFSVARRMRNGAMRSCMDLRVTGLQENFNRVPLLFHKVRKSHRNFYFDMKFRARIKCNKHPWLHRNYQGLKESFNDDRLAGFEREI